jgi:hypothetical protein
MKIAAALLVVASAAVGQAPKAKVPSDVSVWKGIVLGNDVQAHQLYLRRPGDAMVTTPPPTVTVTPGTLPDIDEVKVVTVVAKITSVDMATRTIGFTDGSGKSYSFKVNPGVTAFNSAKVGDQMILSYNESTVIDITK